MITACRHTDQHREENSEVEIGKGTDIDFIISEGGEHHRRVKSGDDRRCHHRNTEDDALEEVGIGHLRESVRIDGEHQCAEDGSKENDKVIFSGEPFLFQFLVQQRQRAEDQTKETEAGRHLM